MSQENDHKDLFLNEAHELLERLASELLNLQKDKDNSRLISEIFRIVHTLKGSAASEGYNEMRDILHRMEDILENIISHKVELTRKVIVVFFACLGALEDIVTSKIENKTDMTNLLDELKQFSSETTAPKPAGCSPKSQESGFTASMINKITQGFKKGLFLFEITVVFEEDDMMKSARAYLVYNSCLRLGEIIKTSPDIQLVDAEEITANKFKIWILGPRIAEEMKEAVDPGGIKAVEIEPITNDDFYNSIENSRIAKTEGVNEMDTTRFRSAIRVDSYQVDEFIGKLKELEASRVRLLSALPGFRQAETAAAPAEDIKGSLFVLNKCIEELMTISLYFVSQPIGLIYARFNRVVFYLSRQSGKDVVFKPGGEDVVLDKDIVDKIGEIVVHFIHNSIEHGIEPPEERLKLGKPKTGEISLKIFTEEQHLLVQITDDGKGLDVSLIKKIAVEKNIITPEEAERMNTEEAINLIFTPGFSTAREVGYASGRGIGMDVIYDVLKKLNGRINYESEHNKGSKFIVRIPLSLCQRKQREIMDMLNKLRAPLETKGN